METGFDFADVVDEAVARSGGEESTAADVVSARRTLRLLTERWTAQRFNTWRVETTKVTISGSTTFIDLPVRVDDVLQINFKRPQTKEQPLRRITAVQYAQHSDKEIKGQPSQYYLQRSERPRLYFYPIGTPSGTNEELIIWFVERPADFERYEDGVLDDVPGRWLEALISGVALDMARKRPGKDGAYNEATITRLKQEATEAETLAMNADRDRSRFRYRIAHP